MHTPQPLTIGGVVRDCVRRGEVPIADVLTLFKDLPEWARVKMPYYSNSADELYRARVAAAHAAKHGAVVALRRTREALAAVAKAHAQIRAICACLLRGHGRRGRDRRHRRVRLAMRL